MMNLNKSCTRVNRKAATKKVNRNLLNSPDRICKYCKNPIPKRPGMSVKRYSIQEFCNRKHYTLFKIVKIICPECGLCFETSSPSVEKYCKLCTKKKAADMKYKKKCANPHCANLIHHKTILIFGFKKFCSLHCFVDFMGEDLKRCVKCNNPLISQNGSMSEYKMKKHHQQCGRFTYFLKKLEELSKRTYINYKESPVHDTIDPNTN